MGLSLIVAAALWSVTTSAAAILADDPRERLRLSPQLAAESNPSAENYSSIEAVSGKTLHLNNHASVSKDCSPAPLPTIRLIDRPKSGTFTVRRGTLSGAQVANCQNLNIPAQGVFYTSRPSFVGEDHVAYEVTTFEGEVEKFDIAITVTAGSEQK
jgi:hypothetical protein